MEKITSLQNPHIKELLKLRTARGQKKIGKIIIEGVHEVERAIKCGHSIEEIFYCPEIIKNPPAAKNIYQISKAIFEKLAYRGSTEGLIATAPAINSTLSALKLSKNPLLIILESVEKPGNLGAILRTADAAGADGIIICDPKVDINNPNVIRASIGTVFSVPTTTATFDETLSFLQRNKIQTIATTPHTKKTYLQADLKKPTAILMGTEKEGLSAKWLSTADEKVAIPMHGIADSLNVSVATTVLVYEAIRQRQ